MRGGIRRARRDQMPATVQHFRQVGNGAGHDGLAHRHGLEHLARHLAARHRGVRQRHDQRVAQSQVERHLAVDPPRGFRIRRRTQDEFSVRGMPQHAPHGFVHRAQDQEGDVLAPQARQCLGENLDALVSAGHAAEHDQHFSFQAQLALQRRDRRRVLRLEAIRIHAHVENPATELALQEPRRAQPHVAFRQAALHPGHVNGIAGVHPVAAPVPEPLAGAPRGGRRAIPLVQIGHHAAPALALRQQCRRQVAAEGLHRNHDVAVDRPGQLADLAEILRKPIDLRTIHGAVLEFVGIHRVRPAPQARADDLDFMFAADVFREARGDAHDGPAQIRHEEGDLHGAFPAKVCASARPPAKARSDQTYSQAPNSPVVSMLRPRSQSRTCRTAAARSRSDTT